jgi:hypothetical protein
MASWRARHPFGAAPDEGIRVDVDVKIFVFPRSRGTRLHG